MPTKDELKELIDKTTNGWTTINGVSGRKFTSKTDASKYIFIPAAGFCNYGSVNNVGNNGHVWSSSLNTSNPYLTWYLNFGSGNCSMLNGTRNDGLSVRGVHA